MSVLTGRYTSNPEGNFGVDIGNIEAQGAGRYLDTIERAELSDAFWEVGLPQQMDTSVASSPYFNVFLASQQRDRITDSSRGTFPYATFSKASRTYITYSRATIYKGMVSNVADTIRSPTMW